MSEVRIVDLEKLGVDIDTFNKIYSMGEEDGRADAIGDAIHHLDNSRVNRHEDYIDGIDFSIGILEQLKERSK